jgi:hypothetical protein
MQPGLDPGRPAKGNQQDRFCIAVADAEIQCFGCTCPLRFWRQPEQDVVTDIGKKVFEPLDLALAFPAEFEGELEDARVAGIALALAGF